MASSTYTRATLSWEGESLSFSNKESDPLAKHILTNLKGWYGGVGVKGEETSRLSHGAFKSKKRRETRPITLEATIVYGKEVDRFHASRYISGILADGDFGTLTVTTGDLTLTSTVQLDGAIQHAFVGTDAIRISIPLEAPDPRLYGEAKRYQLFPAGFGEGLQFPLFSTNNTLTYGDSVTSSKVIVENKGNFEANMVFITDGNFPSGLELLDGRGNSIVFPIPITMSAPVRIDTSGSVTINGIDYSHLLKRRQWFKLKPGEAIQPRVISLQEGDGFVNIELSDTYF